MALQDLTTPPARLRVLGRLSGDQKLAVLKSANPQLVTEIGQLAASPNRVRKFTVETVCEMLTWVEDPQVIEAIVSSDSRTGVCDAARRRLRDLKTEAPQALVANQTNIVRRTTKALEKDAAEAITAIEQMSEFDDRLVSEWIKGLNSADFMKVLASLSGNRFSSVRPAMLARFTEHIEEATVEEVFAAHAEIANPNIIEQLLNHYGPKPWSLAVGVVVSATLSSRYLPFSMRVPPTVSDECAAYWRSIDAVDLLMWARKADITEVRSAMQKAPSGQVETLAQLVSSADQVEVLADEIVKRGWTGMRSLSRTWQSALEAALSVELKEDVAMTILSTAQQHTLIQWLSSRYSNNLPTASAVRKACEQFLTAEDAETFMRRGSGSMDAQGADVFRVIAEHLPGSARAFFGAISTQWNASEATSEAVATFVTEVLGNKEDAWAMFWVLFNRESQGTLVETAQAALALVTSTD